jgi:hypothetical protein
MAKSKEYQAAYYAKRKAAKNSNDAPTLDKDLIRRANDAGTFVDFGDSTNRQYQKNIAEINDMDMTAGERKTAYKELHSLTEAQLQAESQARGAYAPGMGPARFNKESIQKNQSKALSASDNVRNYMENLRKQQAKKQKEREQKAFTTALSGAQNAGKLEFTHNGKTYFRTTKKSSSWYEGTLKDYKAEQKYKKSQKDVPFSKKKSWSSLTPSEKAKYY